MASRKPRSRFIALAELADRNYKRHYRESGVPDASSYAVGRRVASVERPFSGGSEGRRACVGSRRLASGPAPSSAAGALGEVRLRQLRRIRVGDPGGPVQWVGLWMAGPPAVNEDKGCNR